MSERDEIPPSFSPQDALIAVMVAVSAADETVNSRERESISRIVNYLPVFSNYNADRIPMVNQIVYDLLEELDGLLKQSELRILEEVRYELKLDRLHAAAIERGARARHISLPED